MANYRIACFTAKSDEMLLQNVQRIADTTEEIYAAVTDYLHKGIKDIVILYIDNNIGHIAHFKEVLNEDATKEQILLTLLKSTDWDDVQNITVYGEDRRTAYIYRP